MENLFGSDNSEASMSSPEQGGQEMPSTQTQMQDLFGDSDGSKNSSGSE